jgi:UDP-N-acetylglucosamine 2-epimerase (non-hydrolysing)
MMKPLSILTIFGTRPEAIKMAPVVHQLFKAHERVHVHVCVTGQHRQMLDQVLQLFDITPDVDFNIMQSNQTTNYVASQVFQNLDVLLEQLQPDWVLVQGDTTTVMAAGIAAHNRRVKVGHVEAGLRTYDRANPFPEEMNRVVVDHVSDALFAPTVRACQNLMREGISRENIFITGNTVIDALDWVVSQPLPGDVRDLLSQLGISYKVSGKSLVLVTAHRRENFGEPIRHICQALLKLAARGDIQIVYPVHLNPNIREPVYSLLENIPGVTLLPPLDYLTLVHLMRHSRLVLTDSGGIQEEAPTFGVPVLVMRETTERPEAVEAGTSRVVGTDTQKILSEATHLLDDPQAYAAMSQAANPFGDGLASKRIADVLLDGSCQEFGAGL